VIVFYLMFDATLLNPTHVEWLLPNEDSRMQFIGWHFFRHEPWHLPPGAMTQYGLEMGSSIVFSDAIPLLAFIFKPFDVLLPDKFQYMGIWILVCYIAQGAMAWLLSGVVTNRVLQRSVIVVFFVISPIMMNRAIAHHALMGHWLLLAALYLYVRASDEVPTWRWSLLLSTAALVNAYLLYMTVAVWMADIARRVWIDRGMTYKHVARAIATVFLAVLCTMWLAGYFTVPVRDFSPGAAQYGRFAANLNSLWNPLWIPTLFVAPRALLPGTEIEGSNYLGVGILVMVPIAVCALLRRSPMRQPLTRYVPLIVVALILWALALSPQVVWDDKILFTIPLPTFALEVLASIRSSARLLWIPYYGLILAALAVVATRFRPAIATTILIAGLALQVIDEFPRYVSLRQAFHAAFTEQAAGMKPLSSAFWQIAAKHYRRVLFVPVAHKPPGYDVFAFFAADHGMAINVGYFARVSNARIDAANATLRQDLTAGPLRRDSLYVFWNGAPIEDSLSPEDGVGVVDGYSVVAPGWFELRDCCGDATSTPHRRRLSASAPRATAGQVPDASGNAKTHAATFVDQSVPTQMVADQGYTASVRMRNTGTVLWAAADNYRIGSVNPLDNEVWGFRRATVPVSVAPGAAVTFTLALKAPRTPGEYNFQWRMVQDGVEWFGDETPNVLVTVSGPTGKEQR
jgi:hypothetical protein